MPKTVIRTRGRAAAAAPPRDALDELIERARSDADDEQGDEEVGR
jgi:hypothetical protein